MKKVSLLIVVLFASIMFFSCKKVDNSLQQQADGIAVSKLKILTDPVKDVHIVNQNGTWKMLVDGANYFIKGAAISNKISNNYWSNMWSYGGNSIRVYTVDAHTQSILDEAQLHGVTVTLCLYAGHEKFQFDYNDTAAVNQQLRDFKVWVDTYRNHPALLMWAIGNELNSGYTNLKCWDAVNAISQMIHTEDPHHPTSTILSGSSVTTLNNVASRASDLDCVGINAYGAVKNVWTNVTTSNINKPYYLGEYGPTGTWETSDTTSFGTLHEESSTSKANDYKNDYGAYITPKIGHTCLGSYAFIWGYQTQGAVPMWYGMRTREQRAFGALEALQYRWTGSFPANRAPQIASTGNQITLGGHSQADNVTLTAGTNYNGSLSATDPDADPITYEWTVVAEGTQIDQDLSHPGTYPSTLSAIVSQSGNTVVVKAPLTAGKYRLYGFVKDDHNHIASACLPFRVL